MLGSEVNSKGFGQMSNKEKRKSVLSFLKSYIDYSWNKLKENLGLNDDQVSILVQNAIWNLVKNS
jgi:hypothetical protein